MNRSFLGTAAFALGATAIVVSSWLVMWWVWPFWHETPAAELDGTIWHSLYDQQAARVEVSFYLAETFEPDGTYREHRSDYMTFVLDAG